MIAHGALAPRLSAHSACGAGGAGGVVGSSLIVTIFNWIQCIISDDNSMDLVVRCSIILCFPNDQNTSEHNRDHHNFGLI